MTAQEFAALCLADGICPRCLNIGHRYDHHLREDGTCKNCGLDVKAESRAQVAEEQALPFEEAP